VKRSITLYKKNSFFNIELRSGILLLFFFLLLSIYLHVSGDTERSGVIQKNERWTLENSPYIITDDLLISFNARLVITPGVKVITGKPTAYHSGIEQTDHNDSFSVSIKVEGALKCVGRIDNRITFSSQFRDPRRCQWYGIILNSSREGEVELAYCDIADACKGITIKRGSPLLRNIVFEFNSVGIICTQKSKPRIYNCNIVYNFTSGVIVREANPVLFNNIIAFNKDNGIWSDNVSFITLKYNCIYGNIEGNLLGCDPKFGKLTRLNKNKDSTDFAYNLFNDPVFAGSVADSMAVELDLSLQTDKSRIKDTTIAKIIHTTLSDSIARKWISRDFKRYDLSYYSPCINAGNPGKLFLDLDGSKNDMGIYGGQEFVDF
jgi:hypothetical protein